MLLNKKELAACAFGVVGTTLDGIVTAFMINGNPALEGTDMTANLMQKYGIVPGLVIDGIIDVAILGFAVLEGKMLEKYSKGVNMQPLKSVLRMVGKGCV